MAKISFLHPSNAPTECSLSALPRDINIPTLDAYKETVMLIHDESTFSTNENHNIM